MPPDEPERGMIPDEKDMRILRTMAELGTESSDDIQNATGIPKSTVHYRINRLKEAGIVDRAFSDFDRESLGLGLTVISEVYAEYGEGYHDQVGNKLGELNGVNQVYFVMGDTDFIVISHLPTHDRVKNLIQAFEAIEEIQRTSSKFVIQTVKNGDSVVLDWQEADLLEALDIETDGDEGDG